MTTPVPCEVAYLVRVVKDSQLMVQLEEGPVCKVAAHQRVSQKPVQTAKHCSGLAIWHKSNSSSNMAGSGVGRTGNVPSPFQDQPQLYKVCGSKQGRCYEDDEGIFPNGSIEAACIQHLRSITQPHLANTRNLVLKRLYTQCP